MSTMNKPIPKPKPRTRTTRAQQETSAPPSTSTSTSTSSLSAAEIPASAASAKTAGSGLIVKPVSWAETAATVPQNLDSKGRFLKTDVREDEEQFVKLEEMVNLLVAAGYFRARIKGLSSFDKTVGGMTWAIEMCNVDIDVDLMFQESLTIGQKIALTEKIVKVLQKMKCPFRLEPHQIQGMDCIHIFPVIQWLVKKSIEFRQEMGEYIKRYAVGQFNRSHLLPIDLETRSAESKLKAVIGEVDVSNKPKRKYRHPAKHQIKDEKISVKTTLLEYGRLSAAGQSPTSAEEPGETSASEKQIQTLFSDMSEETSSRISASVVGSIVGEKAEEIQKLAEEYAKRQKELQESSVERKEQLLKKKVEKAKNELVKMKEKEKELSDRQETLGREVDRIKEAQAKLKPQFVGEKEEEREKRKHLMLVTDALRRQKGEFKLFCRQEKLRLDQELEHLSKQSFETEDEVELEAEMETDREKLKKVKLLLAQKSKQVATFQRKLDDIPSRAELSQYQKRFVELYNQVSAKHIETKKFYILYNQLDDTRIQQEKELTILNSVLESFNLAIASQSGKDQFISQFEQIVENIKQARVKVEKKRQSEKVKRDLLNQQHLDMVEKQRLYYKAVKDFKEECRKNELLIGKFQNKSNMTPTHGSMSHDD